MPADGYLAEHELSYLAQTYVLGAVVATALGFYRRSRHPDTRVELWALFGGLVGAWVGIWLIALAPVLS
jgi:hypothetical protein